MNQGYTVSQAVNDVLRKVYGWMGVALGVTAAVSYYVGSNPAFYKMLYKMPGLPFILLLIQLGLVIFLSAGIRRMSFGTAISSFFLYSGLVGISLSSIFIAYTLGSIFSAFAVTAGMFTFMAVYGTIMKADLSSMGSYLFMALIGLIITGIVNFFLQSPALYLLYSAAGVLIFTLLTAYDAQKIKALASNLIGSGEDTSKIAVLGALTLYLDFLNLFLYILRFMGNRKD